MAIVYYAGNIVRCLSSDTKPTVADGYLLIETDTGNEVIRQSGAWTRIDALATDTAVAGHAQAHGNADHTAAPIPSTQAFGDAAVTGTNAGPARGDHKHAMMTDPVTAHAAASDPHTGYRLESADHSHASTGLQAGQVAHSALSDIGATDHHSNANDHAQAHGASDHSGDVIPAANQDFGAFYSDIAQIVAPANPGAGVRRVFVNSADGKLKVKTSGGSSVSLEEQGGGGGALTDLTDVTITTPATGEVLRKGAGDWVNAQLAHSDLGSVTSDQHHAQAHTHPESEVTFAATGHEHTGTIQGNLIPTAGLEDNGVSNVKLADMAQALIKGRAVGAGTGDPTDLTAAQATAILDAFTSALKGLAPASGGGTSNFLRADGTWAAPSGGGGSWTTKIKTADQTNNTATLADDDTLQFNTVANTQYTIRLVAFLLTNATQDSKYRLVHTGTTTRVRRRVMRTATTDIAQTFELKTAFDAADVVLSTTGLNPNLSEEIILQVGASGGALKFQWAQVTAGAGPTQCLEGSYLEYATA